MVKINIRIRFCNCHYATEFKVANRNIRMATIKDIRTELEENEMESLAKIRSGVLTHEIMNSITPIASLTQTLDYLIKDVRATYHDSFKDDGEAELIGEIENGHRYHPQTQYRTAPFL